MTQDPKAILMAANTTDEMIERLDLVPLTSQMARAQADLHAEMAAQIATLKSQLAEREGRADTIDAAHLIFERDFARTKLEAAEAQLKAAVEALENAERWFRDYERQHRLKGTSDGNLKADTNEERADYMVDAIAALTRPDPSLGSESMKMLVDTEWLVGQKHLVDEKTGGGILLPQWAKDEYNARIDRLLSALRSGGGV